MTVDRDSVSDVCDTRNLDKEFRSDEIAAYAEARRRIFLEIFGINLVHRLEVGEIGDEDLTVGHVRKRRAARRQHRLDIFQHSARLRLDVTASDQLSVLVERQKAGGVDHIARLRTGRERRDRRWRSGRDEDLFRHDKLPFTEPVA